VLEQLKDPENRLSCQSRARIPVTNLDRLYWPAAAQGQPGVTKRDFCGISLASRAHAAAPR